MSYTDELFDNNFSFISSLISLQHFFEEKKQTFMRLLLGGAYFWEEGAYYRSLISSLQQMRLLLGGAYYRGALIIGSLRYLGSITMLYGCVDFYPTSSPRPYASPEENETISSRFLQERHMAVGTRLDFYQDFRFFSLKIQVLEC